MNNKAELPKDVDELDKNGDSILTATLEEIITKEIGKCPEKLVARLVKYIIKNEEAERELFLATALTLADSMGKLDYGKLYRKIKRIL